MNELSKVCTAFVALFIISCSSNDFHKEIKDGNQERVELRKNESIGESEVNFWPMYMYELLLKKKLLFTIPK